MSYTYFPKPAGLPGWLKPIPLITGIDIIFSFL